MKTKFTIPFKFKPSFNVWHNMKQWWHKYGRYSIYIMYLICIAFFLAPIIIDLITNSHCASSCLASKFGLVNKDGSTKDFYTFWIAIWGVIGIVINIIHSQIRIQNQDKQIDLQSKSQRDSRFSKGIELLGNDNESARTGAAYSLCFLAKDFPDEFSKPVFDILCSHIRTLTTSEEYLKKHPTVSNEVQTILDLLFKNIEYRNNNSYPYFADLKGSHLEKAKLEQAHLEATNLKGAHLEGAYLIDPFLEYAFLVEAHLEGAYWVETYIEGIHLEGIQLEGIHLEGIHLEGAYISSSIRPYLEEMGLDLSSVNWLGNKK